MLLFHIGYGCRRHKSNAVQIMATFEQRLTSMTIMKHGDIFQNHVNEFDLASIDQATNANSYEDRFVLFNRAMRIRSILTCQKVFLILKVRHCLEEERRVKKPPRNEKTDLDGFLCVTVAENDNTGNTAQYWAEIFEKCPEEGYHFACGNIQCSADCIAILWRFLMRIESIRQEFEARNFIGNR